LDQGDMHQNVQLMLVITKIHLNGDFLRGIKLVDLKNQSVKIRLMILKVNLVELNIIVGRKL
jgi:hypothetical protein